MREFDRIKQHFAPLAHPQYSLKLQDDAAILDVPADKQLVITTDTLNETVHFIGNETPDLIARKALRVNLSDLAAMGAEPLAYTLNLALPRHIDDTFIAAFCEGLQADQALFNIALIGGDSTASQKGISISITAFGLVDTGHALTRSKAQVGDGVFVTGTIGEGALGLHVAQGTRHNDAWLAHYQLPTPRLDIASKLIGHATACMDISDGLLQDLAHLCAASGVGADIHLPHIPVADKTALETCISGGDDYQLLFTAPADFSCEDTTRIGTITEHTTRYLDANNSPVTFSHKGYQHF